jgi:hypothetical protein
MPPCQRTSWCRSSLLVVVVLGIQPILPARSLDFPGTEPGPARYRRDPGKLILENDVLGLHWNVAGDRLWPDHIADKLSGRVFSLVGNECFQILFADSPSPEPWILKASDLRMLGQPQVETLTPNRSAPRLAEHLGGKQIRVRLAWADGRVEVEWRALLRDGSNYVQCCLEPKASREPLEVKEIVLWDLVIPRARVMGSVDGVPVMNRRILSPRSVLFSARARISRSCTSSRN